ncbi:aspartate/glutamate racemase family protein [Chloroflexota bacterium]
MAKEEKKYRFCLIPAFRMPSNSRFYPQNKDLPKEERLMNYKSIEHLMGDVEWDMHEGALAPYGDWPVENREEFCLAAAARVRIVREVCESGKYNGLILLGGGEPGFFESREIARNFGIPVTSCAFSQMHIASMLCNKFSVIDIAESHNMFYYNLVVQHHFTQRCASIRNLDLPLPRPGSNDETTIMKERDKALRGESSIAVERAVTEAVAAIEEDGAEVIHFGCSATFWLQPFVEKRLAEMGWEVPVLEGYSCAIVLAKAMVDLGVDVSGLFLPSDRPKKVRRKKIF